MDRIKSKYMVNVFDLEKSKAGILKLYKKKYPNREKVEIICCNFGVIFTKKGPFIVNDEGFSHRYPMVNKDIQFTMEFYIVYEDNEGKKFETKHPYCTIVIDMDNVKKFELREQKRLNDFIKSVEPKHDKRYFLLERWLDKAKGE